MLGRNETCSTHSHHDLVVAWVDLLREASHLVQHRHNHLGPPAHDLSTAAINDSSPCVPPHLTHTLVSQDSNPSVQRHQTLMEAHQLQADLVPSRQAQSNQPPLMVITALEADLPATKYLVPPHRTLRTADPRLAQEQQTVDRQAAAALSTLLAAQWSWLQLRLLKIRMAHSVADGRKASIIPTRTLKSRLG